VRFSEVNLAFLDQLTEGVGIVLNSIAATMRTEQLLKQSQAPDRGAAEPAAGADRDQQAPRDPGPDPAAVRGAPQAAAGGAAAGQRGAGERAELLAQQKAAVEGKNREVEGARMLLQEKAEQLR
jgi:hypothetical protein